MKIAHAVISGSLSAEELQCRMKSADSIEQFRRYQVIFLRLTNPEMSVSQVANVCGVAYRTVTQWTWYYNHRQIEDYLLSGRGGRRNSHLSEKAEEALLSGLRDKAEKGQVITVQSVKKAAEKVLGHELAKDYAYDLLHRHHWRKIMPHTYHPQKDQSAQNTFKKTSRICWIPPENNYPKAQHKD